MVLDHVGVEVIKIPLIHALFVMILPAWSNWGPWTPCSLTCGEGLQERSRACDSPNDCPGPGREVRSCTSGNACPELSGRSAGKFVNVYYATSPLSYLSYYKVEKSFGSSKVVQVVRTCSNNFEDVQSNTSFHRLY